MAQQMESAVYKVLSTQPEYRAALLAQVGKQFALRQLDQPEYAQRSQRTFQQAIALLSNVSEGEPREAALQSISRQLIEADQPEQAQLLIQQMNDPALSQFELAIELARHQRYRDSVAVAIQIRDEMALPELKQLVQVLIQNGQLNCALQVTFLPQVKELALAQVIPDLIPAIVLSRRTEDAFKIGRILEQESVWLLNDFNQVLAETNYEIAFRWSQTVKNPNNRFWLLTTLAKALAETNNTAFTTQVLTEAEQAAKILLAEPIPSPLAAPPRGIVLESANEAPPAPAQISIANYEEYARLAVHARHQLTFAPIYNAMGQQSKAIAMLHDALNIAFSQKAVHPLSGEDYRYLAEEVLREYQKLMTTNQATEQATTYLNTLYQTSSNLPAGELKSRHLSGLSLGYALFGQPDRALEILPFSVNPSSVQQPIILALLQQRKFDTALQLVQQTQSDSYPNIHHTLETWAEVVLALAIAEQGDRAEEAFSELLTRFNQETQRHPNEDWFQQWLPKWSQRFAEHRLYTLAQRLLLNRYTIAEDYDSNQTHPSYQNLDLPVLPLNQLLIQAAEIAVSNGDTTEGFELIQAIPTSFDRVRGFAQLVNDLETMGYPDLVDKALKIAEDNARSHPQDIRQIRALLEINQAAVQSGRFEGMDDRFDRIFEALE
jgi:hypothetical protein